MKRKDVIDLLTKAGHSVEKAIEIAIDYERGDDFARAWVKSVQSPDWPLTYALIHDGKR